MAAVQTLDEAGTPRAQIARTLDISRSSVYRCLDQPRSPA
ncbi:helix-turn-helix domain-containing protein [Mycobacterium nebraskense]|nr:helix-turn-helix domain-containing protein [Mycobacterium nebraskense]